MKKIVSIAIIFLLHQTLSVYCQVKEPEKPSIPDFNNNNDSQSNKYKVRIRAQGRDDFIEEEIILNSDIISTPDNKIIKMKDLGRIQILQWEKRIKIDKYIFYPSRYELYFQDSKKIILNGNIEFLNKIKLNNKSGYIFTYYYDIYLKGKWINSGFKNFNSVITKPAYGCVMTIELIQ